MQHLLIIVDECADVIRRLSRAADGVAAKMRAFAKVADEMQVRRLAQTPSTVVRPTFVAYVPRSVATMVCATYFADGADLEYG